MNLAKGLRILSARLATQGVRVTALWAADHAVRIVAGANIRRMSQITPGLHIGGQYSRRGWRRLQARGVTAVLNLRVEFDDQVRGIAPPRYLHLPTPDDDAPSLRDLRAGVEFIADELSRGGAVYVHCGSGVGRAPMMAAAYLVYTGLTPEQAWSQVRTRRPFIRPTATQMAQVDRFAREGHPPVQRP